MILPSMAISHPPLAGLVFDLLPDVDIACQNGEQDYTGYCRRRLNHLTAGRGPRRHGRPGSRMGDISLR